MTTHEFALQRQKITVSRNFLLGVTSLSAQVRDSLLTTIQVIFVEGTKQSENRILLQKKMVEEKFNNLKKLMEEEYLMHESLNESGGTVMRQIDELKESYIRLEELLSEAVRLSKKNNPAELKQVLRKAREVNFVDFFKKITVIIDRETGEVNEENIYIEHSISKLRRMSVLFSLAAFCLALATMYGITKSLTGPLQKLDEAAQELYAGNFDVFLSMKGKDEIANLSRTFNKTALSLKNNREALEQQQLALFESSKLATMGQMARGVAHEINSPLAAMVLGAELIERKNSKLADSNKDITKLTNSIIDAGSRIEAIVKGLKGFSRDAKEDEEDFFSLRHLVNTSLDLCGEMFRANKVEVIVQENQMDTKIHGNITLLSQCLFNLIINSFEAITPLEEKWIQIGVTVEDKQLEIRITDSGKGIPHEIRNQIFQPMYTTKSVGKGPGLGLRVSRSIVTNFGGNIVHDETSDNTCFIVRLPYS